MYHVHFIRDLLRKVPKEFWGKITRWLKEALVSKESLKRLIRGIGGRIKTTNMLERVNKEMKRCCGVIG